MNPMTCAPAAGASATRSLPAGCSAATAGAAVPVSHAPSIGASPVGGWWPTSSPSEGLYPLGGFTNYLQSNPFANHPNGNNIPENFHFVGAAMSQSSISPIDMGAKETPSPAQNDVVDDVDAQGTETINVDEDDTLQDVRTVKRLNWSVDEDIRLASAWLHNSKDPVDGTGRKAEQYWADVTETYNNTIEGCRKRNRTN